MKHVHVCLVSDQPIPNLTTVFQFRPHRVILLSTKDKSLQAERLERVIKKHKYDVVIREILPYDINNVAAVSESLINEYKDCSVSLNITGGTKIGTLGTFQSFYTAGKPIYYVNTRDNEIIQVYPAEEKSPIESPIKIKDYLAAYGFRIDRYIKDDSYIYKRKKITEFLAHLTVEHGKLIGTINYTIDRTVREPEKASYPLSINLPENDKTIRLCNLLDSYGLVDKVKKTSIRVRNSDIVRYLKGIWFEEYVYMIAKSLPVGDVKMEVHGQWDVTGKRAVKNEFDVMIAKRNRLYYISCKTSDPNRKEDDDMESVSKEYLYELDSLGDKALGLFGKKMLASARRVTNEYVRKRAEVLNIKIIDGKSILTLKEQLLKWLN